MTLDRFFGFLFRVLTLPLLLPVALVIGVVWAWVEVVASAYFWLATDESPESVLGRLVHIDYTESFHDKRPGLPEPNFGFSGPIRESPENRGGG